MVGSRLRVRCRCLLRAWGTSPLRRQSGFVREMSFRAERVTPVGDSDEALTWAARPGAALWSGRGSSHPSTVRGASTSAACLPVEGAADSSVVSTALGTTVVPKLLPQRPGGKDLGREAALVAAIQADGTRGGETGALVLPAIPLPVRVGQGSAEEAMDGVDGTVRLGEAIMVKPQLRNAGEWPKS